MITTITLNDFVDAFRSHNREENFSYSGLEALFDHLGDYEESTGQPLELDVIGLCVDYTEYESGIEACAVAGQSFDDEEEAQEWLYDETIVIKFDGGVIVADF